MPHQTRRHDLQNPLPSFAVSVLGSPIRPYVRAELDAAAGTSAGFAANFRKLERAHVLSLVSTGEHVRVHWHMLVWAVRQRDTREFFGLSLRNIGAATKTAIGLGPTGNTGGSNIGPDTIPMAAP